MTRDVNLGPAAPDALRATMVADILRGLRATPRMLPNKYLWDERGSALFDRICEDPDYHPAHSEKPLLSAATPAVAQALGARCTIVEFGCGAGRKVDLLLEALPQVRRYVGLDISEAFMQAALRDLRARWPDLDIVAVAADYSKPLPSLPIERPCPVLGFFPGSSICNMTPRDAGKLLMRLREVVAPGWLLIGGDPPAPAARLEQVYNSEAMHAFHENLLTRLVEQGGATLERDAFLHRAHVAPDPVRVVARLIARRATQLIVGEETFRFDRGDAIVTDCSCKYTSDDFQALAKAAGWSATDTWSDRDGRFNLYLLRA